MNPNFDPSQNNFNKWSQQNLDGLALTRNSSSSLYYDSSLHAYDASFIDIKTLSIRYNIDKDNLPLAFKGISFTAMINNLYTFTSIKDGDNGFGKLDVNKLVKNSVGYNGSTPLTRDFSLGINLIF